MSQCDSYSSKVANHLNDFSAFRIEEGTDEIAFIREDGRRTRVWYRRGRTRMSRVSTEIRDWTMVVEATSARQSCCNQGCGVAQQAVNYDCLMLYFGTLAASGT